MMQLHDLAEEQHQHLDDRLTLAEALRHRLGAIRMRFSALWPEVKRFGRWLELDVLPATREQGESVLHLAVTPDAQLRPLHAGASALAGQLENYSHLVGFLRELGIKRLELDVRLESNQIADVMTLLFAFRRGLQRARRGEPADGVMSRLRSDSGVPIACTRTRMRDGTLGIAYSYCATRFSRLVRWYERRHRHFRDHRALFYSAPRSALLVAAIAAVPFLVYTFNDNWSLLLVVTAVGAVTLFAITYLFFMTVGSLEYDNEIKAYRLRLAYDELRRYAERIRNDLRRARIVQEKMLPVTSNMPLADRLDWASSFCPEAEVGGDYFDAAAIDEDRVAILFADVSGHGMAAAFITAILKTTFQAWVDEGRTLADFVSRLNHHLFRLTPDDSFAALFVAIYDRSNNGLCYVNCGHYPEPWHIPADSAEPIQQLSDARATLLGIQQAISAPPAATRLKPGDKILLVTDGVIEARNAEQEMYGEARLEALLQAHRGCSVEQLVDLVVGQVADHARDARQVDDRTILAFQVK